MVAIEWLPTHLNESKRELEVAYANFWAETKKLLGKSALPKQLTVTITAEKSGESLRVNTGRSEALTLLGLANGAVPKVTAFDVYLSSSQVVRRAKGADGKPVWICVASEVELLYLNALESSERSQAWRDKAKKSFACAGYQFFVHTSPDWRRHSPDCYARYCLTTFSEDTIRRKYTEQGGEWTYRASHGEPCIPSAPMDLVGVVYTLLHNHAPSSVGTGWPAKLAKIVASMPCFRIIGDRRFPSDIWYEHTHRPAVIVAAPLPTRAPESFVLPDGVKNASWRATIAGWETGQEDPHLTIWRGDTAVARLDLRDFEPMKGSGTFPNEIREVINSDRPGWRKCWNANYPQFEMKDIE